MKRRSNTHLSWKKGSFQPNRLKCKTLMRLTCQTLFLRRVAWLSTPTGTNTVCLVCIITLPLEMDLLECILLLVLCLQEVWCHSLESHNRVECPKVLPQGVHSRCLNKAFTELRCLPPLRRAMEWVLAIRQQVARKAQPTRHPLECHRACQEVSLMQTQLCTMGSISSTWVSIKLESATTMAMAPNLEAVYRVASDINK